MSTYTTLFGSYQNYLTWNNGRSDREYLVVLTNTDTSEEEIVLDNPQGITKFGFNIARHERYSGMFETVSLSLGFAKKTGGGGDFIKDAYDSKAIRANVLCDVYKKNPETNDFDILYNYKVDYNEKSYLDEQFYINCSLTQIGIVQTVTSRDELDVDITKNISIDGDTVSDTSTTELIYPGIDVYLFGNAESGLMSHSASYEAPTGTDLYFYEFGGPIDELTGGRINLEDPTVGKVYINTSDESKDVRLVSQFTYKVESDFAAGNSLSLKIFFATYNASGTELTKEYIGTFLNSGEDLKEETQSFDFTGNYNPVPVDGWAIFGVDIDYVCPDDCEIFSAGFIGYNYHNIDERSNSIGDTTATSYRLTNAMLKSMRIMTGIDDCFYWNSLSQNIIDIWITSGRKLRNFPDKGITFKFTDLFDSCNFTESIGLGFDSASNRFYLAELEEFYQDVLMVDFGVVKNFELMPSSHYYNEIASGSNEDGKYEKKQGVQEFNIQTSHASSFIVPNKTSFRVPFIIDSLSFEFTKREQYESTGQTDTKKDNDVFMANGGLTSIYTNVYSPEGFLGVEDYYNTRYIPRECIKRLGGRLGLFWKDTDESILFRSNKKDINITYNPGDGSGVVNLNDDIPQADLATPLFYPEKHKFTPVLTPERLAAIRANPYGYYKVETEEGIIHYGYLTNFEAQDFEESAGVEGLTANINR